MKKLLKKILGTLKILQSLSMSEKAVIEEYYQVHRALLRPNSDFLNTDWESGINLPKVVPPLPDRLKRVEHDRFTIIHDLFPHLFHK